MIMYGLNRQASRLMSLNTLRIVLEKLSVLFRDRGFGIRSPQQSAAPLRREWHFGHLSLCQAREKHRFVEWIVLHLQVEREAREPFEMRPLQITSLSLYIEMHLHLEKIMKRQQTSARNNGKH